MRQSVNENEGKNRKLLQVLVEYEYRYFCAFAKMLTAYQSQMISITFNLIIVLK